MPARVEVRNAATGAIETQFPIRGRVRALALSAATAAVLVEENGRRRIDRFDARTGRPRGSIPVVRSTTQIDVDGETLVYLSGSDIRVVSPSRRLHVKTPVKPIGLSIERSRVAWAENVGGRGRIRAVFVP